MQALISSLLLSLMLLSCTSAPGAPSNKSPQEGAPGLSLRQAAKEPPAELAQAFVRALNKPAPREAAQLVAWDLYALQDTDLKGLMEELKKDLESHRDARTLDHPLLPGSSITRRQLLLAQDEDALLGNLLRQRFQRQAARDFSLERRKNKARIVLFDAGRKAGLTTLLMPDGHLADFKVIWHKGHFRLLPLF